MGHTWASCSASCAAGRLAGAWPRCCPSGHSERDHSERDGRAGREHIAQAGPGQLSGVGRVQLSPSTGGPSTARSTTPAAAAEHDRDDGPQQSTTERARMPARQAQLTACTRAQLTDHGRAGRG